MLWFKGDAVSGMLHSTALLAGEADFLERFKAPSSCGGSCDTG